MRALDRVFGSLLLSCFWCYINYQIYLGLTIRELNVPLGRSRHIISHVESPIEFWVCFTSTVMLSLAFCLFVLFNIYLNVDEEVKAFGGNYNVNTFRAIFRKRWKSH